MTKTISSLSIGLLPARTKAFETHVLGQLMNKLIKSMSTRGPGRGDTCHLTDFSETWPD